MLSAVCAACAIICCNDWCEVKSDLFLGGSFPKTVCSSSSSSITIFETLVKLFETIYSHVMTCAVSSLSGSDWVARTCRPSWTKSKWEKNHNKKHKSLGTFFFFFALYLYLKCVMYRGNLACMDPKASRVHQELLYVVLCMILTFQAHLNLRNH